jgi:oxygen-dependent protoporphyrinogen oxidase
MKPAREVAIVGGGISGLTAALAIAERSGGAVNATVYEAGAIAGGNARTLEQDGYLIEAGPNGFLENDASRTVLAWLTLDARVIEANPASNRRYIVRGGRLREVPHGPLGLLFGDALSVPGRLRVLCEPWIRSRTAPGESVFAFARRRIGDEAARVLVDAAVGGITAGDSRTLEVESAFPVMVEMEREHGSLVRGMLTRARAARAHGTPRRPKSRLVSLPRGVSELVRAFERRLGARLRTGAGVRSLTRAHNRWQLQFADGASAEADAVVVATQARAAAKLLRGLDADLGGRLGAVPFSGVGVVALAWPERALPRPLAGYGFLVPAAERGRTLGVVWESALFAGRAPAGHVLVRAMIGGAREPGAVDESDESLVLRARHDIARIMGLRSEPARVWVSRAHDAIAQYSLGHAQRLAAVRAAAGRHPGLVLCGTSYDGVSMGAAMAAGLVAAEHVIRDAAGVATGPGAGREETGAGGTAHAEAVHSLLETTARRSA